VHRGLTTDTVVVTAIKKPDLVLPVAPPAAPLAAVAPLPADTSPGSSTGRFTYYPDCAAARAAGVAPCAGESWVIAPGLTATVTVSPANNTNLDRDCNQPIRSEHV